MRYNTFKRLTSLLHPGIVLASGKKQGSRNHLHHGPILPEVCLACALHWFAGGPIYDIMTTFGISHTDALESCWHVVDAVNTHPSLKIAYPDDHEEQHSIAHSFSQESAASSYVQGKTLRSLKSPACIKPWYCTKISTVLCTRTIV
jgi:hypothetical protein